MTDHDLERPADDHEDDLDATEGASQRPSKWSRPPAPTFDLGTKSLTEMASAMSSDEGYDDEGVDGDEEDFDDEEYDDEASDEDEDFDDDEEDFDDDDEEYDDEEYDDEEYDDEDFDDEEDFDDDEEDFDDELPETRPEVTAGAATTEEPRDPNATTLETVIGPMPTSSAPSSPISVEEAADDDGWEDSFPGEPASGFLAEEDEPPLSSEGRRDVASHRSAEDTLMPITAQVEEDDDVPPLPGVSRRQARLRRGVGLFLAAIALGAVGLATRAAMQPDAPVASAPATPAAATPPPPAEEEPAPSPAAAAPAVEAEAAATETARDLPEDFAALRNETLDLLEKRDLKEAERAARELVRRRPNHAIGYRCLGAALQDQGDLRGARDVFSDCVTHATDGDVQECVALGGVKKTP